MVLLTTLLKVLLVTPYSPSRWFVDVGEETQLRLGRA
jgi:hypothetical protein